MQKTLLIIRQEIYKILHSPGYVIFAFIVPVAAVLVLGVIKSIQARSGQSSYSPSAASPTQAAVAVEGYVDQSGLVRAIPSAIPAGKLLSFEDEKQAQKALEAGKISAYYVIPPDFIQRGEVDYVYPNTRSYLEDGQQWVMSRTLTFNLLDGDARLADHVWNPVWDVTATSIAPQSQGGAPGGEDCSRPGAACQSNDLVRYMPSIIAVIFFMVFMTSSSMLFNSIGAEKENRAIEVLLLSISPQQLLAGKTLGLGLAGLLQTIAWLGAIYISFNIGGSTISLPENFTFPAHILLWGMLFFFGGYGLYASLMAGAGAMIPKMKEAGIATYIVTIPLFFGYAFALLAPLAEATDSAFLVFLSIFPLTSPVVMIMRLTSNVIPAWQLLLSAGLTYLTAYFILRAAAAMFQVQNLLSGQPFSIIRYFKALLGRT